LAALEVRYGHERLEEVEEERLVGAVCLWAVDESLEEVDESVKELGADEALDGLWRLDGDAQRFEQ